MILFVVLLVLMFLALAAQHFIAPIPPVGARVMIMPIIMFYGALALPLPGMLALTFCGGFMWDALHAQVVEGNYEIAVGWSIILYAVLGGLMSGFRPLFQRGRWEIHCLLSGVCTSVIVLAEYLMITFRREPVTFIFNNNVWGSVLGTGLVALLLSPFVFFALNWVAYLTNYDPQPLRKAKR